MRLMIQKMVHVIHDYEDKNEEFRSSTRFKMLLGQVKAENIIKSMDINGEFISKLLHFNVVKGCKRARRLKTVNVVTAYKMKHKNDNNGSSSNTIVQ